MMQRQRILSMTVSSSLTPAIAGNDRPTSTRIVSHALQPLDRGFGTICRQGFASLTMTLENFAGS